MSGGPKFEYYWTDGDKYKKPTALPAPTVGHRASVAMLFVGLFLILLLFECIRTYIRTYVHTYAFVSESLRSHLSFVRFTVNLELAMVMQ